ncbi:MAG: ATP-dependent DNA helicase [Calditrichaeota bacterium]|nr:MAG: ATP-dependent DNA helicase [Calditrichota bacterium]MBL1205381.1 ATP-dependent DNA helicase [Calditrichota bacterium]NOG45210.1 ATP-dependent DNA helicase [Calditrichota bacterium]
MAIKIENKLISLSVRDLVPATQNSQILSSFPMPQRGALGRQAQTFLQKGRTNKKGMFHSEYSLNRSYDFLDYTFQISGRIDGVFKLPNRAEIEEIKSVILKKGEFSKVNSELYPHFIHQLLLYAYLLQDELDGQEIVPYLVLINLVDYKDRTFPVNYNRAEVETILQQRFGEIVNEIEENQAEIKRREAELSLVKFSLSESRPQQNEMMDAVNQALQEKQHLLVSAPTGTGKTAASLFPAIQYAFARDKRIMFVTSKTSQQEIVKETIKPILQQGLDLKVIFLKASQKMCANDIYFCHEAHCPFAREYKARRDESGIILRLMENSLLTPELIYSEAEQEELCPFEVSLDASLNCDLIIGDYNYVFDPAVQLRRLFFYKDYSDWILIIDEAHNLYERGRQYLSPQIRRNKVQLMRDSLKNKKEKIYKNLKKALSEVDKLFEVFQQEGETHFANQQYFETDINVVAWDEAFTFFESAYISYLIYKIRKGMLIIEDPLEAIYFLLRRFLQVARFKEAAFVTYYDASDGGILNIQCNDPAMYLGQKIDSFHSVLAMSATLDPINYYCDVLGFPEYRTNTLQLDSPFSKENRKIIIVPHISTRFKDRQKNYPKIAEVIKETINLKKGNYLVFFPSYDFMQNVNLFLGNISSEKILQKPGMNEEARDAVLEGLKNSKKVHLLMGVMGGMFSEGVDYSGDMAVGVIVVSPALPQFGYERELLNRYYENKNGQGQHYAYLYPGMNKVIQAVGRLIRSFTDKGIILLIGERFAEEKYNSILPGYWFDKRGDIVISKNYKKEIRSFWNRLK